MYHTALFYSKHFGRVQHVEGLPYARVDNIKIKFLVFASSSLCVSALSNRVTIHRETPHQPPLWRKNRVKCNFGQKGLNLCHHRCHGDDRYFSPIVRVTTITNRLLALAELVANTLVFRLCGLIFLDR